MKNSLNEIMKIKQSYQNIPPTEIFNEGWMLRLIMNWYSKNSIPQDKLYFEKNSSWYSEALLATHFTKANKYVNNEARTHADGVIGNFSIGKHNNKGGLNLNPNAEQFVVLEGKMGSKLSLGVRNANNYNQVARSIACMAETIFVDKVNLNSINKLAFYVVAPKSNRKIVLALLDKPNIQNVVQLRMNPNDNWFNNNFIPVLNQIDIDILYFEDLIDEIKLRDSIYGNDLEIFYIECLKHI